MDGQSKKINSIFDKQDSVCKWPQSRGQTQTSRQVRSFEERIAKPETLPLLTTCSFPGQTSRNSSDLPQRRWHCSGAVETLDFDWCQWQEVPSDWISAVNKTKQLHWTFLWKKRVFLEGLTLNPWLQFPKFMFSEKYPFLSFKSLTHPWALTFIVVIQCSTTLKDTKTETVWTEEQTDPTWLCSF